MNQVEFRRFHRIAPGQQPGNRELLKCTDETYQQIEENNWRCQVEWLHCEILPTNLRHQRSLLHKVTLARPVA